VRRVHGGEITAATTALGLLMAFGEAAADLHG
jgi:hypothetical protein